MSYSPCKSVITGYLTGKQGEPKVRRKSFPASDKGEGREYCEVTVSMKMKDGEKWFVSCQLPIFEYDRLCRVGEHSHVTISGSMNRKVKGDRTFYDLHFAEFHGERTADPRDEDQGDKPAKSKVKSKGKAAPPPVEDDGDDTGADDDDTEF